MSRLSSLSYSPSASSRARRKGEPHPEPDSRQEEMTISQMSRLYGVSLRTLRFYEDRGLIKPRREGNARYYRDGDRARMDMILRGKKLGFTLAEITRPDRRQGRERDARPRGAPAAAADRQPDRPPRAAARGDRQRDRAAARRPTAAGSRGGRLTRSGWAALARPPLRLDARGLDDPRRLGDGGLDARAASCRAGRRRRPGEAGRPRAPKSRASRFSDVGQNGGVVGPLAALGQFEGAALRARRRRWR